MSQFGKTVTIMNTLGTPTDRLQMTSSVKMKQDRMRRRGFRGLGIGLTSTIAFALAILACGASFASDLQPDGLVSLRVGVNGVYKNGFQTPVFVEWGDQVGEATELELETVDSDGAQFVLRTALNENEKKAKRAERSLVFPKAAGYLTVRLFNGDKTLLERKAVPSDKRSEKDPVLFLTPSSPSRVLYVVVGDDNIGFAEAFAELRLKEEKRPVVVKVDSTTDLPSDFRSFEAIDRLFLTTSDPGCYADASTDSPQILAAERWCERGGSIALLAGSQSVPLLASGGALERFSPGNTIAPQTHEFRVVNSFITDLEHVKNLAMTGSRSNPYLQTPVASDLKEGVRVEMREAETPLLVARPVGLGTIVYFAADLSCPPISNWSGRGRLLLKILGVDPDRPISASVQSSFVKRGYCDLSGQLRSALDSFDGVRVVPFSFAAVLMFVYLLVIAPLDWFLVKKVFKRPIATWITFPLSVLIFCAIAVWAAISSSPKEPIMNQTDLIDVDMTSGIARDSSWFGFYSPFGTRYNFDFGAGKFSTGPDCSIGVDSAETVATLAPLTLSGEGIGGAEQKAYIQRVWDEPYRLGSSDGVASICAAPTTARSSKSFFGRWTSRLNNLPQPPELIDDGMALTGEVVNPFDVPIYSAHIIYNGGAYSLGTLAPGATPIERGATRVEALRVLNEPRSSIPSSSSLTWESTSYNGASTRAPYILRAASFYDFGGGEDNYGIAKRLQADVDLSALLRCGRAVIFGVVVDAECDEYDTTDELARKAADAIELEKLNKKLAAEKGETLESAREAAIARFGTTGSSDEFLPTLASWRANGDESSVAAAKRVSVIRLVVPLKRAADKDAASN